MAVAILVAVIALVLGVTMRRCAPSMTWSPGPERQDSTNTWRDQRAAPED
jgi:hypothetical protein